MADKEGKILNGQFIRQDNNHEQKPELNPQRKQEGSLSVSLMDQEVLRKLSQTPAGEDPAFWPIQVLNELEDTLSIKNNPNLSPFTRVMVEKYAPYEESIRRVKTAYSILAYPHCQYEGWKDQIGAQLETRRQLFGEDQVELNSQELKVLSQITAARKIPFNHEKQVYSHSEVPIPHWINPFGRRHMTTEEIREWLAGPRKSSPVLPNPDGTKPAR